MSKNELIKTDDEEVNELFSLIGEQVADPARLLECYYWSGEPGIAECIRAIIAMPVDARVALFTFFASAVVRSSISTTVNKDGSLTLYAPEAASILKRLLKSKAATAPVVYRC